MNDGLTIDVVSDVICPWCFIGKRRLETLTGSRLLTRSPEFATDSSPL
jgi:predicted DsbA family dithiol-disulfide isomerase